jgi:hypothetical protein
VRPPTATTTHSRWPSTGTRISCVRPGAGLASGVRHRGGEGAHDSSGPSIAAMTASHRRPRSRITPWTPARDIRRQRFRLRAAVTQLTHHTPLGARASRGGRGCRGAAAGAVHRSPSRCASGSSVGQLSTSSTTLATSPSGISRGIPAGSTVLAVRCGSWSGLRR